MSTMMMTGSESSSSLRAKRLFLVDEHSVAREGLARILKDEPGLAVCGQAGTAARAMEGIESLRPDLVVVDVSLGRGRSGLELIKELGKRLPHLPILVLSSHVETFYAERALRGGAKGYVTKQEPLEQILAAIRTVLSGGTFVSPQMGEHLLRKLMQPDSMPTDSGIDQLSDRELEVFRLLGQGHGTKQIAQELHLSASTVETHRTHIKVKLGLADATRLVRRAVEWVRSVEP